MRAMASTWSPSARPILSARVRGAKPIFPSARVTDDFDSVLRDPNVRVLDIATHADVRLDLMRRALNADKHVLSQKPFVENLDDGRELVELGERRGLKLAVNQNGRWAPHLAYIREAVRVRAHRRSHRRSCRDPLEPRLDRGDVFRSDGRSHPLGFRHPLVRFPRERHWRPRPFRSRDDRSSRGTDRATAASGSGADQL